MAIAEEIPDAIEQGIIGHVLVTLYEWMLGFGLAVAVGVFLGLVAGRSRIWVPFVERWCMFWLIFPIVALVPLFILWIGIGTELKILLAFLTALPSVALNTVEGVRSGSAQYAALARSFQTGRTRMFLTVIVPGAAPFILAGIRVASGRALLGVVFGELVASSQGLGFAINVAGAAFDTNRLMLGIGLLGLIAVIVGKTLEIAERKVHGWTA